MQKACGDDSTIAISDDFPCDSFSTRLSPEDKQALELLESLTCNADTVQRHVLSEILSCNSDTEYLRTLGLGASTDLHTFKHVVPLVSYHDIEPFIKRIAHGDTAPILTAHPISLLYSSSGTSSGQPKLIPTHDDDDQRRKSLFDRLVNALTRRSAGEAGLVEEDGGKWLFFLFVKPEFRTLGGLPVRTFATNACKSAEFHSFAKSVLTSPAEVIVCENVSQSMYCQLLCGLMRCSEVACIGAVFASGLLRVIHFLQELWQELVEDIRSGTVDTGVVTDPVVRGVVESLIADLGGPNPELAHQVEVECKREPRWKGIIHRLWPRAKYVPTVLTGAMVQYVPMLEFYAGGLPLVSTSYGSSEAIFGVNLAPFCHPSNISYTLLPNMVYFEFLPISQAYCTDDGGEPALGEVSASNLVDLVDVKLGEEYEIVITTYAGLYRYRMGDILRVTGFYNKTPQFCFVGRRDVVLSIDVDKTDEKTLQDSINAATSTHLEGAGWRLVEYTSYADVSTAPGHYVMFWELISDGALTTGEEVELPEATVLEACCLAMEESLDSVYRRGRVHDKSIGPLEIRVVNKGTFDLVMEFLATKGGSSFSQYKTPRCVDNQQRAPILHLLNSRVCLSYFSQKCPCWAPPTGFSSVER